MVQRCALVQGETSSRCGQWHARDLHSRVNTRGEQLFWSIDFLPSGGAKQEGLMLMEPMRLMSEPEVERMLIDGYNVERSPEEEEMVAKAGDPFDDPAKFVKAFGLDSLDPALVSQQRGRVYKHSDCASLGVGIDYSQWYERLCPVTLRLLALRVKCEKTRRGSDSTSSLLSSEQDQLSREEVLPIRALALATAEAHDATKAHVDTNRETDSE